MRSARGRRALIGVAAVFTIMVAAATATTVLQMPRPSRTCSEVRRWVGPAPTDTAPRRPMGLAWSDGLLYVADAERGVVERYTPDGTLRSAWTGLGRPVAVAPADEVVYVADFRGDRVAALSRDGRVVRTWGRHGTGAGEFDAPSGIAVDAMGNVYVTDFYNHRVQVFDRDGRFLRAWGERGRMPGKFRFPTGITVTSAGDVFVADGFNHRVQRFTADGHHRGTWGGIGFGVSGRWPGWFALAKDIAVAPTGLIYVTDAFNGRLQSFTTDGRLVAVWGGGRVASRPVRYASGIAVNPEGRVFVGDFYGSALWELDCR